MKRVIALAALALLLAGTATAAGKPFPEKIALPNGWQPEGIAIAPGGTFYAGSIPTGAVYRGSLRTGRGSVLVPAREGRAAIGVEYAGKRLYVAGGSTGKGFVYDARTGADIATYQLATGSGGTFVNDVVVTRDTAWLTDSQRPVLYKVTLATGAVQAVPLTGDYVHVAGFNLNGIDATRDGARLVVVQSSTGKLFTVDPRTGATRAIDLGGATVVNGDGLLLVGRTLYVVQNRDNKVAVVALAADYASGRLVRTLTDRDFDVPTTMDDFGARLYAVNARFGTTGADAKYHVVQFRRR
jgi:outer membrane protein assembly factor BamB